MDLDQLRAFIAILDHGSILAAADVLGVTRPTLRARVAALEADVAAPLLQRSNRGVAATEAGERFATGARTLLRDADALVVATRRARHEAIGTLRIISPAASLPPMMATIVARELRRRHPDLTMQVHGSADPLADAGPDTDIVLHFGDMPADGPFRTFVLKRFPVYLLASRAYLRAHGRPDRVEALADHPLICWTGPGGDGLRWPLRAGGSFDVEAAVQSNAVLQLRALAAAGLGIALLPDEPTARGAIPGEDFETVLPEHVGREGCLRVLVRADGSARTRALVALLRDVATGVFGHTPAEAGG